MAQKRRAPEIIAGRVNADGTIAAGDGFTVQKTGTGQYVLAFGNFRLIATVASVLNATGDADPNAHAANTVIINTFTLAAAAQDLPFSFIAVGTQT